MKDLIKLPGTQIWFAGCQVAIISYQENVKSTVAILGSEKEPIKGEGLFPLLQTGHISICEGHISFHCTQKIPITTYP